MKKPNHDNYYNKYQYLIWIDKKGFIDLDKFSTDELIEFNKSLSVEIKKRNTDSPPKETSDGKAK